MIYLLWRRNVINPKPFEPRSLETISGSFIGPNTLNRKKNEENFNRELIFLREIVYINHQ
jgi:hypothetical protein